MNRMFYKLYCTLNLYSVLTLFWGNTMVNGHDLVNIQDINPRIIVDIKYATTHNFTHKKVYTHAVCYVRRSVADKLDKVQKELEKNKLGLKIFDGYRPRSVQYIFWDLMPDPRYVADPAKGSRHNRGSAVDVTLVDSTGKELAMPTPFDDFTIKAHRNYTKLPAAVIANRALLESVMIKFGFVGLPTEWWHFDDAQWQKYELLDIPLSDLIKNK